MDQLVEDNPVLRSRQARPQPDIRVEPTVEEEGGRSVEERGEARFETEVLRRVAVEEAGRGRSIW
jgi:hypothetical protein